MRIGQLAEATGVSIDTIRFYERRGVLPPPQRRPSGYRTYTDATTHRIRMARTLQELGFTLDEVIDALHDHDSGTATCDNQLWRLEAVIDRIDSRITELRRARRTTVRTIANCRAGRCQLTPPDLDSSPG
ncbi:MAG TPA: MerR family transcriptional regulator [Mycobacteriales bacterium]|nr:MerR family transcriptional regulator [Mycobacteriales bacterium]